MELLEWVVQASQSATNAKQLIQSQNLSSLIFAAYVALSVSIKDSRFLAAFFMCELWAQGIWVSEYGELSFYAVYAVIYGFLYWSAVKRYSWFVVTSVMLMMVFEIWMTIDAANYKGVNSFFYENYIYFVVFIHLCIVASFVKWRLLTKRMGKIVISLLDRLTVSYNHALYLLYFR